MDPRVFHKVSYGMYVVGSRGAGDGAVVSAQISNTVIQVSARPEQVSVALHRDNYTHELVAASGVYSACILRQDAPMEHIGRFGFASGRDGDKLAGIEHRTGVTGSPIVLPHSVGVIEVQVKQSVELSTHTLFIGEVVGTEMLGGGEPLTYEHYHLVKKGKSPERAPVTFVEHDEDDAPSAAPGRYRCGVCGYTHDEGSDGSFDALPEDWKCPVCGASKGVFAPA